MSVNWRSLNRSVSRMVSIKNPGAGDGLSQVDRHGNDTEYESFYRCSKRWLYNEEKQLTLRYLRFNVPALKQVAARAVGANKCVVMVKTAEGSFNKIFTLRFDNGAEVIARIPCPIAGPAHLLVASEVATLDFVRTHMQMPVPKVLAWSSNESKNEVGAEYIIMEKLNGVPLSDRWPEIRGQAVLQCILEIISYEKRFSDFRFSQIGSLYFKEDVAPALQARRLYADGVPDDEASEKYRIGPTLQREFWRGERINMDIDRGPWPDTQSYALAIIECEQFWLRTHARPRSASDPFLMSEEEGDPEKHLEMLDRFKSIIPLIICGQDIFQPTLWHADLHGSNIMVHSAGPAEITGIIDWQEWIGPKFLKAGFPRLLRYEGDLIDLRANKPALPNDFEDLSKERQDEARVQMRSAARHKVYDVQMRKLDPSHSEVLDDPRYEALVSLFESASRTWTDGLVLLRQALLAVAASWYTTVGPEVHCPIGEMDEDEFQNQARLFERTVLYEARIKMLYEALKLGPDGVVDPEQYDAMKAAADRERALWDDERDGGPWPLQDGAWSSLL